MATYFLAVLALGLCLVQQGQGQPRITVTPTQLNLTPNTTSIGGTVTVKCEPPSSDVRTLLGLIIYQVLHSNPNAPRVEVVSAGSDQNNGNPSLIPGTSVTGTIDGSISQNFISLTMSQAKCRDGGMYICEASYFKTGTGNIVETVDVSRNLTVEVTPGAITLTATPSGVTTWTFNETLTLTCNGPVGTVEGNTQVTWNWQYRMTTDNFVDWRPYDGPNSDIQDGATTKPDPCYENRISILTRSLTLDDTSRIYRCFITKGQEYSQFAAEFSVGTVTTSGGAGTGGSTGTDGGSGAPAAAANIGAIVGGIIGALVVIIVIIVIVVFVLRRKRANKGPETYDADGSKPADVQSPPYTPTDPAVTYSQPNRFRKDNKNRGHTNQAMDEEPRNEKIAPYSSKPAPYESKPARYENDFNQGHRNRAYDYDNHPRARRYSSDDGGTDSHVNTSQHSIGDGDPSLGTAI